MYLDYFELKEKPFQLTPDFNFLYLSKMHARAKAYMEYAIWNRDGFVVITGEIGSGKTTLIHDLLSRVDDNVIVAKVHQTQLDELEFFQAVLVEFGFKLFNSGKVELLETLKRFLFEQHAAGKQVVLVIDEAQNLSPRVLEEVRLLTGLETDKEKVLNLILLGQPELKDTLDSPGMEQLSQRTRFRWHIKPLSEPEVAEYIKHRLSVAGHQGRSLFPASTLPLIYRYTGGTPRLINLLCDTALITAFVENLKTITADVVEMAIEELGWAPFSERARARLGSASHAAPGNNKPLVRLIQLRPGEAFYEHPLAKECVTIGRVPSNDIVLADMMVSGHHAKIVSIHGHCFLEDLNSTNGTFVNAARIKACVLKSGDLVRFGQHQLKFVCESLPGFEASPPPSSHERTAVISIDKHLLKD